MYHSGRTSTETGSPTHATKRPSRFPRSMLDNVEYMTTSFKVLPCPTQRQHDWKTCPFKHAGERVARRDLRVHPYHGIACWSFKEGEETVCPQGDACPFAHNAFELWLHPSRYRTQLCRDGQACRRKVCFFAHAVHELRVPEEAQQVQGPPTQCQTTDAGHGMSSVGPTSGPPPDLAAAASQLAGMALSQPSSSLQAAAAGERAAALDTLSVEQQVQVMLMLQHARKQEEEREQQAAQAALLQSYTLQQLQRSSQQAQVASSKAMVEASQAQAPGYYDPASTRLAMPATYTVGNLPPPATSCPSYPNTMPARAAMLAPPVAPPVRGSAPLLEPMTYPVPVVPAPTAAFRPLEVAYRAAASQPAAAGLSSLLPRQQGLNMPSSGMAALQLQQLQHSPSDLGAHQQLIQGGWCQDLLPTSAAFGPKSSSSGCSGLSSGFSQLAGIGSTTGSNTELPAGAALGCYSSYASSSCSGDLLASPVHAGQQREGMLRLQGLKLQTSVGSAQKQGAGSSQGQPWLLYGPADNTMWLQ